MSSKESQKIGSRLEKQPLITNASIGGDEDEDLPTILDDAMDTIRLGVPIFVAMLSWVGMKTTDSALLGHVSSDALSAAALSDLWTMCTAVFIQARVLGVLCGAALGAGNPKLAGIYLQVSYFVLSGLCAFVFICWFFTENFWLLLGSDPKVSHMAGYYARVLALSLPGQLVFSQLSQFFSCQRIMYPEVNASSLALILNLVLGLVFVLGIPIPGWSGFGFEACPVVTSLVIYVQLFVVLFFYVYKERLHEPCWPGWSWADITRQRINTFCELYIPAALGTASDFWRVAVVGAVAARLGELEVAVFNTSYRIMWIVLVMVNAISSASGIKTSTRLGNMDHMGAKQAGHVGIYMSVLILTAVAGLVLCQVRSLGRIFTNDEAFLTMLEEARWPFTYVCCYFYFYRDAYRTVLSDTFKCSVTLVLMNLSVALERIPYSMGRTKEVFWYGLIASVSSRLVALAVTHGL
jgi:multidrug resistance protein, MATE family